MATKKIKKMEIKIQDEDYAFDWTDEDLYCYSVDEQIKKLAVLQSKGKSINDFSVVKQVVILDKYLKWHACQRKQDETNTKLS